MSDHERLPRALDGVNPTSTFGVFQIAGRRYRVVPMEGLTDAEGAPGDRAITRLDIDGKTCGIVRAKPDRGDTRPDVLQVLTARELQVATLVAAGQKNQQIARELHISKWTVVAYLRRIFLKLGVDNRVALASRYTTLIDQHPKPELDDVMGGALGRIALEP